MKPIVIAACLTIASALCIAEPVSAQPMPVAAYGRPAYGRPAHVRPTYARPGRGYAWMNHPRHGWGWHHPRYGWHRGWR